MNEIIKNDVQDNTYSVEHLPPDDIETVYDDVLSSASGDPRTGDEVAHPQADTDIPVDSTAVTDGTEDILSTELSTEASTEVPIVIGEPETDPVAYWKSMNCALWIIAFILLFAFCYERIKNGFRATKKLSKGK